MYAMLTAIAAGASMLLFVSFSGRPLSAASIALAAVATVVALGLVNALGLYTHVVLRA